MSLLNGRMILCPQLNLTMVEAFLLRQNMPNELILQIKLTLI
jgi:hypothetical protein